MTEVSKQYLPAHDSNTGTKARVGTKQERSHEQPSQMAHKDFASPPTLIRRTGLVHTHHVRITLCTNSRLLKTVDI